MIFIFSKTKHSKLKQSPAAGPNTRVKPANGFALTTYRLYRCSESSGM